MSTAILFDTETNARENPEIIEAAWAFVRFGNPTTLDIGSQAINAVRLRPDRTIELGALATHHIMDEDLEGCDPSCTFELPPCDYAIGHNCDFDLDAAAAPTRIKRIDTCALARHLWPTLDCYSQSALLYHLDRANARERLKGAHSAASDILICKTILDAEIAEINRGDQPVNSWEELWQHSETARIPAKMPWGKHRDMPIKDLPKDYIAWCLRLDDLDPYLRIALTGKQPQRSLL